MLICDSRVCVYAYVKIYYECVFPHIFTATFAAAWLSRPLKLVI
jgi:hypothetical protein